ncbi:HigA family addiction module antidote protein [Candidatus Sumerlaeota bacterium]|nr:HigA family addiction module antidote protein [Candidatus Sumerlaeota bacterium]
MASRTPAEVFPPGEFIKDELEERGWTQADLARIMGRNAASLNQVITGKVAVTPETAKQLSEAFGTSPEYWLHLDAAYRLARSDPADSTIRKMARLHEIAPISDMARRGWIEVSESVEDLEAQLCRFYMTSSLDEPPGLRSAARATPDGKSGAASIARLAWKYRAFHLAAAVPAEPHTERKLDSMVSDLRGLAKHPEELRRVPGILAQMGIRLVIIQHLPKSKIDGATLWPQDDSPVIALSLRYDRIDSFWHTLAHEISHVRNGDGECFDEDLVGMHRAEATSEMEERADAEAAALLVTPQQLDSFISCVRPYFSKEKIIQFAHQVGVHPGIVVGQLQHRGEIPFSANREMLVKVRTHIIDSTVTDGWGHTPQLS